MSKPGRGWWSLFLFETLFFIINTFLSKGLSLASWIALGFMVLTALIALLAKIRHENHLQLQQPKPKPKPETFQVSEETAKEIEEVTGNKEENEIEDDYRPRRRPNWEGMIGPAFFLIFMLIAGLVFWTVIKPVITPLNVSQENVQVSDNTTASVAVAENPEPQQVEVKEAVIDNLSEQITSLKAQEDNPFGNIFPFSNIFSVINDHFLLIVAGTIIFFVVFKPRRRVWL